MAVSESVNQKSDWLPKNSSEKHVSLCVMRDIASMSSIKGVLKAKILEAKYEAKLEFPGGMGVQNKKPSVCKGEYGYFLELHNIKIF